MFSFLVYGFLGWLMQSIYQSIRQATPVNAGFLILPFCPLYGLCMLFLVVFVYPHGLNLLLLLLVCFVVVALIEYFTGWAFEQLFKVWLWDYRKYDYNINGRISPIWSAFWSAIAACALVFLQPEILAVEKYLPPWAAPAIVGLIIVDVVVSVKVLLKLKRRLAEMTDLRASFSDYLQRSNAYEDPRQWLGFTGIHFGNEAISTVQQMGMQVVTSGDVPEEELAASLALIKVRYEKRRRPSFTERRLLAAFPLLRVYEESESLAELNW